MLTSVYSKLFCLAHLRQFLYQEDTHSKGQCSEIYFAVLRLTLESAEPKSFQALFVFTAVLHFPQLLKCLFYQVTSPRALHQPAICAESLTAWSPAVPYLSCASVGMCDGVVGTGDFTLKRGLKH